MSDKLVFDAKFHAFMELAKLVDIFLPKGYQLTQVQCDAIHNCATTLAKDLTSGDYVFKERKYRTKS